MLFIFLAVFVFCSNIHPIIFPKTISLQPIISSIQYTNLYDKYDKHTKLLSKKKNQ